VRKRARDASLRALSLLAASLLSLLARTAVAEPQASAGVTVGAAFPGVVGPRSPVGLHLGGRADVLLLRASERDMAVGPYVDVATTEFHDVDFGGGAEWLVPLTEDVPLVLAAGVFARNGGGRSWSPGAEGTLFVGSRSYNFHSWYGLAVGFFAQGRWVPESPATFDAVAGVQIDAEILAMPFLFLYTAITH
jgi:hypothetical protein